MPLRHCLRHDLQDVFEQAGEGAVIDIPAGTHEITDTLRVKAWQVIRGNNAIIKPIGDFSGKPVMDYTSAFNTSSHNLRVIGSAGAACGVKVSRGVTHGAGNHFYDCIVQGAFTEAVLWSNSEGNSYDGCQFITDNDKPALRYDGANTLGWWNKCSFRNYSGLENVALVRLGQTVSGLSFRDCYFYVGKNGTALQVSGAASTCIVHDCRVEGEGAGSLLLDNLDASTLYQWDVARINYAIPSNYMVRTTNKHLHECVFDFTHSTYAARYFHIVGAFLWRCRVYGNKPDWVTLTGGQIRMNHLYWTQGNPLPITGDNSVEWTG